MGRNQSESTIVSDGVSDNYGHARELDVPTPA